MNKEVVYQKWTDVREAAQSSYFRGSTADTAKDREKFDLPQINSEALFTQSNARILLGHSPNGTLRFLTLPTQVYPVPTQSNEFGYGPGMYYHTDNVMYMGDLSYSVQFDDGRETIDLSSLNRSNETSYRDHFLPVTTVKEEDLTFTITSFAPVAADAQGAPLAPAPLPGPAGAFFMLHMHNRGKSEVKGKVILKASDAVIGHYEDLRQELRPYKTPDVDFRQKTLLLTRPDGTVGVHLMGGTWNQGENGFSAEVEFHLQPGEDAAFETQIALGGSRSEVMPTIYELNLRKPLDWLNATAAFWKTRLGRLQVKAAAAHNEAEMSLDIHIRSQLDNFNCLQTDAQGNLIAHRQGAPSHGFGTIWGIDVEPTAVSVVWICPELTKQTFLFFTSRSHVAIGGRDPVHSLPIFVAPVIIARAWLQNTGNLAFFNDHPDVLRDLKNIMETVISLQSKEDVLFPSRFSSDGAVGRKYDYGTNVKVWYAFDSLAYMYRNLGQNETAHRYETIAENIRQAIGRHMMANGPFGRQISGGTNLNEDPGTFYSPEDVPYYDGEDTSSMLAPVYGMCDYTDEAWVNYHRFARSLFCHNYDPEYDTLLWNAAEPMAVDGTALVSRLGGSISTDEMVEAIQIMIRVGIDESTGSLYWWPFGQEEKRGITRCSQGQGAWVWQYMKQWLGIEIDCLEHTLTIAPRGLLTKVEWQHFTGQGFDFGIFWEEGPHGTNVMVENHSGTEWQVKIGVRDLGAGAQGSLTWHSRTVSARLEGLFENKSTITGQKVFTSQDVFRIEANKMADPEGLLFFRYGPAYFFDPVTFDVRKTPLAIRFVVGNHSLERWNRVRVELQLPDGWAAEGRKPGMQQMRGVRNFQQERECIELGALESDCRTVAAFSVKRPNTYNFANSGTELKQFHLPSQPGNDVRLFTRDIDQAEEHLLQATLYAITDSGQDIEEQLVVPVHFIPYEEYWKYTPVSTPAKSPIIIE